MQHYRNPLRHWRNAHGSRQRTGGFDWVSRQAFLPMVCCGVLSFVGEKSLAVVLSVHWLGSGNYSFVLLGQGPLLVAQCWVVTVPSLVMMLVMMKVACIFSPFLPPGSAEVESRGLQAVSRRGQSCGHVLAQPLSAAGLQLILPLHRVPCTSDTFQASMSVSTALRYGQGPCILQLGVLVDFVPQ